MLCQTLRMVGRSVVRPLQQTALPSARPSPRRAMITVSRAAYENAGADVGAPAAQPPRAFSKFNIYKGKAAVQISLIGPTWKNTAKGGVYVDREGVMFLEFASSSAMSGQQTGYGDRSYNWEQKSVFALKPAELGLFLDEKLVSKGFELYHDPDKGGQNEGQMRKTLSVKLNPDSSFMFSINQNEKSGTRQSVAVPVTPAEMAVIRNLAAYAVPRLLGFDMVADGMHSMQ